MKAVLISIKPKWCDLIRRGRKTVEVRKTCPKLEVPFKVYIYETMDGGRGSGLVFGEFVCNGFDVFRPIGKGISIKRFPALYESCLTLDEIVKYGWGLSSSPQFMQMGTFKLKNGWKINTYGDYDKDGWKVPNRSAMPWEKNNFRGAFELKSANGNFGIRIEVQQGRNGLY